MSTEELALNTIDRRERLRRSLGKLNTRWQQLIVVLWLMGYTQREIAGVFGVSQQSINGVIQLYKTKNELKRLNREVKTNGNHN